MSLGNVELSSRAWGHVSWGCRDSGMWVHGRRDGGDAGTGHFQMVKSFGQFYFQTHFLSEISRSAMVHPPCLGGAQQSIKS